MRRLGSLLPLRTGCWSTGQGMAIGRRNNAVFPTDGAETVRRGVKGHDNIMQLMVLVGVAEWGMIGTCRPMSSPYIKCRKV